MKNIFKSILAFAALLVSVPSLHAQIAPDVYKEDPNHPGFVYSKEVEGPNSKGEYTIYLKSFMTGTITESEKRIPSEIILVLDVSGSMDQNISGGGTKINALKNAVKKFITQINEDATEHSVNNKIAIVKFAGARYCNSSGQQDTNGQDKSDATGSHKGSWNIPGYGSVYQNYSEIVKGFTSVATQTGVTELTTAINNLDPDGPTAVEYGLYKARALMRTLYDTPAGGWSDDTTNPTPKEVTNKIVVVFTDGEPNHASGFDPNVATTAITIAKQLKSWTSFNDKDTGASGKVKVYTIGTFGGTPSDNVTTYMNRVSSNYPNASGMGQNQGGSGGDAGYYMLANNADDLVKAFGKISSDVASPAFIIKNNAASVVDIVAKSYAIPKEATSSEVKVYTAPCTGYANNQYTFSRTISEWTNAITFDGTTYPVTGIGEAAFMGCTELVTIHIPSSVTTLEANAFYDCKRLTSVYYNLPAEEVTSISEEVFQNVNPMIILYVPAQSRLTFRKTIGWSSFKNIIANDNFKEEATLAATATHPIDFTAKAEPVIIEKPGKKAKAVSKEKTSTKKEKTVKEKTSTKKEKPVVKEKPVIKKEKTISKEKPSTKKEKPIVKEEKPVVKEEAPIKKKLTKSEKAALKMKEEKAAQQAYLKAEAEKAAKKKALKAEKAKEKARKAAEKEAAKKAEKEVAKRAEKKEKTKKSSSQTTLLVPSFMKQQEDAAAKAEPTTSVETPVVETPIVETPVVETPVVETPVVTTEAEPTTVQPTVPTQEEATAVVPEPAPTPTITHPAELTTLVNTMNSTLPKSLGAGVGITEEKLILEKDFLIMPYSVDEDQNPNIDALLKTLGKNFDSTEIDKLIDLRLPQNRRLVKMLAEKNYGLKYRYQASKHPDFFVEKVVKAEELKKY